MAQEYVDLEQQLKRQAQRQQEAAARKLQQQFASVGRLRSGAAAKLVGQATQEIEGQLGEQLAGLKKEQADKQREERLIEEQRGFQSAEREAQERFASSERAATQDFQASQAQLDRALQDKNINLGFDTLREQQRQFDAEFGENVRTNLFNKLIALKDVNPASFAQAAEFLGYSAEQIGSVVGAMTKPAASSAGGGSRSSGASTAPTTTTGSAAAPKPAASAPAAKPASTPASTFLKNTGASKALMTAADAATKKNPALKDFIQQIAGAKNIPVAQRNVIIDQLIKSGSNGVAIKGYGTTKFDSDAIRNLSNKLRAYGYTRLSNNLGNYKG